MTEERWCPEDPGLGGNVRLAVVLLLAVGACSGSRGAWGGMGDDGDEACGAGEDECGGDCVPACAHEEVRDLESCACERRCREGRIWEAGRCVPIGGDGDADSDADAEADADSNEHCLPGETDCAGECRDIDADDDHCGRCFAACAPFFACDRGECVCDGTPEQCGEDFCGDGDCNGGETEDGCPEDYHPSTS